MAKKFWMAKAFAKNKGLLHKKTKTPPGKPISPAKLQRAAAKAERTGDTTLAREVSAAKTGARIAREHSSA